MPSIKSTLKLEQRLIIKADGKEEEDDKTLRRRQRKNMGKYQDQCWSLFLEKEEFFFFWWSVKWINYKQTKRRNLHVVLSNASVCVWEFEVETENILSITSPPANLFVEIER